MNSPYSIFPKRSITATLKVKNIKKRINATLTMFLRDSQRAFNKFFKPLEDFTIRSSLATLIILSAVTLKEKISSSIARIESRTIRKSNLFHVSKK
jgi:hypothetical protein